MVTVLSIYCLMAAIRRCSNCVEVCVCEKRGASHCEFVKWSKQECLKSGSERGRKSVGIADLNRCDNHDDNRITSQRITTVQLWIIRLIY